MKLTGGAPEHTIALPAAIVWQTPLRATATDQRVAVVEDFRRNDFLQCKRENRTRQRNVPGASVTGIQGAWGDET